MATVGVSASFDGRQVETGLQRLTGSAQKFAGDLEKKLSFKGIAGSVLSGFGLASGFAVAEKAAAKIAGYWERAASAAEAIAAASDRSTKAILARIRLNETPEQEVSRLERDSARLRATTGGSTLREAISSTLPFGAAMLGRLMGDRSPEEQSRARAEALAQADENDLRVAELRKQIAERDAAALKAAVAVTDELASARERNALAELSDLERANALRAKIQSLRAGAGDNEQGFRDRIQAENLVPEERAARQRALDNMVAATLQDIYGNQPEGRIQSPAIVASSLARVGGGGNVAVFGGGDMALAESRRQTGYLAQIASNTARGGAFITAAPASDVGN